jgi:hypothetical protein
MSAAGDFVGDKAVEERPSGPAAGDCGGGIYQDTVEIE